MWYSFSFRWSVRREMPSFSAAFVRFPPHSFSARSISSLSFRSRSQPDDGSSRVFVIPGDTFSRMFAGTLSMVYSLPLHRTTMRSMQFFSSRILPRHS